MTTQADSQIASILAGCRTLSDAAARLEHLVPSKAERWGLWDGWAGREPSLAGLPLMPAVGSNGAPLQAFDEYGAPVPAAQVCDSQAELDYNAGCAAGFVLRHERIAA